MNVEKFRLFVDVGLHNNHDVHLGSSAFVSLRYQYTTTLEFND